MPNIPLNVIAGAARCVARTSDFTGPAGAVPSYRDGSDAEQGCALLELASTGHPCHVSPVGHQLWSAPPRMHPGYEVLGRLEGLTLHTTRFPDGGAFLSGSVGSGKSTSLLEAFAPVMYRRQIRARG